MAHNIGTGLVGRVPVDDRKRVLGFIKSRGPGLILIDGSNLVPCPACNASSVVNEAARSELCLGDEVHRFEGYQDTAVDMVGDVQLWRTVGTSIRTGRVTARRTAA